MKTILCW